MVSISLLASLGGMHPAGDEVDVASTESPVPEAPMDGSDAGWVISQSRCLFQENKGQLGPGAGRYFIEGEPLSAAFSGGWVSLRLIDEDGSGRGALVRMVFPGSNPVMPRGQGPVGHTTSRMEGNAPDAWVRGIRSYQRVVYPNLYDGVDLSYSVEGGRLKYEFVVHPGGDPGLIRVEYQGVEGLSIEEGTGDLLVRTVAGTMRDSAPVSYQGDGPGRSPVESRFLLLEGGTVGLSVPRHDATRPLVIDPSLNYSSFLGGGKWEQYMDMAVDGEGAVYIAGQTESADFPTTPGAWDVALDGAFDIFALKVNASLDKLDYSTYIGGTSSDQAEAVAVDEHGRLFIAGRSDSNNYPTTANAYAQVKSLGFDAVLTVLNETGEDLVYSTFLGRSGYDHAVDVCLDRAGCAYVASSTKSDNFPTSVGAFDRTYAGSTDMAITKFNLTKSYLIYSTFLGGSEMDYATGIAVDASGSAYVTGYTMSSDLPATQGAYDTQLGGVLDSFVCKVDPTGSDLDYLTYIGGKRWEYLHGIAVDDRGRAYVTGSSASGDFPVKAGAYDTTKDGERDLVVVCLKSDGSGLHASTFVGGKDEERGLSIVMGDDASVYVTGYDTGNDFPLTLNGSRPTDSTSNNIVLLKMDTDLTTLQFSTLYGSPSSDTGLALELDDAQGLYLMGQTQGGAFPVTANALNGTFNGGQDVVLLKWVDFSAPRFLSDGTPSSVGTGDPLTFSLTVSDPEGLEGVEVRYWSVDLITVRRSMDLASGTEEQGTWRSTVDAPRTSQADLSYVFYAKDINDNYLITQNGTIELVDDDPPTVVNRTHGTPYTGSHFSFRCLAQDNIGMTSVHVVYWMRSDPSTKSNLSMTRSSTDVWGNGLYKRTVLAPENDTGLMDYQFHVMDTNGLWGRSPVYTEVVVDNMPPRFLDLAGTDVAVTGDHFHFEAVVLDNIAISQVRVQYWVRGDEGTTQEGEMDLAGPADGGGEVHELDVLLSPTCPGDFLSYRFLAYDTNDNFVKTQDMRADVLDHAPPVLVDDGSDEVATTGDVFHLEVTVEDVIGIGSVHVIYWFGSGVDAAENVSIMDPQGVGEDDLVCQHDGLVVPTDSLVPLSYRFALGDTSCNWNETEVVTVDVVDNDPGTVVEDLSDEEAKTSVVFTFSCEVEDNIGIESVAAVIQLPGREERTLPMRRVRVHGLGNGTYMTTMKMPDDVKGELLYSFLMTDTSGNENPPNWTTVQLIDFIGPSLVAGEMPERVLKGTDITFNVTAEDLLGVREVRMLVVLDGSQESNVSMSGDVDFRATYSVPRESDERITVTFLAWDTSGNMNATDPVTVLLYNSPPALAEVPTWDLKVGEPNTLDLSPYVSDPNDPKDSIELSCLVDSITVKGLRLRAIFEEGSGDIQVAITLSDGEDRAAYTIDINLEGKEKDEGGPGAVVVLTLTLLAMAVAASVSVARRGRGRG